MSEFVEQIQFQARESKDVESARQTGKALRQRIASKVKSPLSEMLRHGVGEEPTPAVSQTRNFSGWKLEDISWGCSQELLGSQRAWNKKVSSYVFETNLSNKDKEESLLFLLFKWRPIKLLAFFSHLYVKLRRELKERVAFPKTSWHQEPQPLRSGEFPDDFFMTVKSDKLRVGESSLQTYCWVAQAAIEMGNAVCIRNPSNSIRWKTSPFVCLLKGFHKWKASPSPWCTQSHLW